MQRVGYSDHGRRCLHRGKIGQKRPCVPLRRWDDPLLSPSLGASRRIPQGATAWLHCRGACHKAPGTAPDQSENRLAAASNRPCQS